MKRAAHRYRLLAATEAEFTKVEHMVEARHLTDPAMIGAGVGKVINKRKVGKHFLTSIGNGAFTWARDQQAIDTEAAFD